MKKLNLVFIALFGAILVSCGGSSDTSLDDLTDNIGSFSSIYIDNNADTTVNVTIEAIDGDDSWDFEIEGYDGESTTLDHGKYHVTAVTVTDSTIVDADFEVTDASSYYNLNLTREDYIVENITYYLNPDDAPVYGVSFSYDGETYDGWDADVIDGELLIAKDWDYNLHEETPEEVELDYGSNQTTRRKLWRASTFILLLQLEALLEEYGDGYDWDSEEY